MEYLDQTEFEQRAWRLRDLIQRGIVDLEPLDTAEREYIERYFLRATTHEDMARYRCGELKQSPNLDYLASRAYERLIARVGLSFTLPDETSV